MLETVLAAAVGGLIALIGTIITVKFEGNTARRTHSLKALEVTNEKLLEQFDRMEARIQNMEDEIGGLKREATRLRSLLNTAVSTLFKWQRWHEAGCKGEPPSLPVDLEEY